MVFAFMCCCCRCNWWCVWIARYGSKRIFILLIVTGDTETVRYIEIEIIIELNVEYRRGEIWMRGQCCMCKREFLFLFYIKLVIIYCCKLRWLDRCVNVAEVGDKQMEFRIDSGRKNIKGEIIQFLHQWRQRFPKRRKTKDFINFFFDLIKMPTRIL